MTDLTHYPPEIQPRLRLWERQGVLERILKVCAEHYASVEEVLGKDKTRRIAHARQAVCADIRSIMKDGEHVFSYPDIASMLDLEHSTVRTATKRSTQRKAA